MKRLAILLPMLLAACNQGPSVDVENASAKDVAKAVDESGAGTGFMSPGQWEGTVTIHNVDIPGLPAEFAEQMKSQMAKANSFSNCLTPADVEKPKGEFFGGEGDSCRYEKFKLGGGVIDGVMSCSNEGVTHRTTMKGSYSPTTYDLEVSSEMAGPAKANVSMSVSAKRVGACTGE